MKLYTDKLGKVAVTIEKDYWSNTKDYDKLTIVQATNGEYNTYISRKPVPAGTVLTDRNYWIPFSSLKEEIVLDFNTFVNLWTNNLSEVDTRLDSKIDSKVEKIYTDMDSSNQEIYTTISQTRETLQQTDTGLQNQISTNATNIVRVNNDLLRKEQEIYQTITTLVIGGVALKQEFGNEVNYGISQKVITEKIDEIQDKIDKLHPVVFGISLAAAPNLIYDGVQSNVVVSGAMLNEKPANIKLYKGNELIYEEDNIAEFNEEVEVSTRTTFNVQAEQNGLTYENQITVNTTNPFYIGAGSTYNTIIDNQYKQSIKTNPSGTYIITVQNNQDYIFIIVPSNMNVNRVTSSNFQVPITSATSIIVDGKSYKYYRTANSLDSGTYTIVIS